MKVAIFIPARFASTRYPGKPLVEITGATGTAKPLIARSFEAATRVAGVAVHVVTDDDRIADVCRSFGAPVIMTSPAARNGTERCAEALDQIGEVDLVVNFQGDSLLTPPTYVEALIEAMRGDPRAEVATPAIVLGASEVRALQAEEAAGRVGGTSVVTDMRGRALYFSKRLIPHLPEGLLDRDERTPVKLHIGVYAYRPDVLRTYVRLPVSQLEQLEGLEQLRFLDAGIAVRVVEVQPPPFALRELNNPEDLEPIEQALKDAGLA